MNEYNQKGQILIVLLMTLIVGLTIGLVIVQRSLFGVTTSNQSEQSTRAFAAAEAGIEQAIRVGPAATPGIIVLNSNIGNDSRVEVTKSRHLPAPGQALEYPPINKATIAQFWLANPTTYDQVYPPGPGTSINVYFGCRNGTQEPACLTNSGGPEGNPPPAAEISLISRDASGTYILEPLGPGGRPVAIYNSVANTNDGFASCPFPNPPEINTSNSRSTTESPNRFFRCRVNIPMPVGRVPILMRVRILSSDGSHPIAVSPVGSGNRLPEQAVIYTSVGSFGQSQKTLQHFRLSYVVPPFFNYAIFSIGEIDKQ